jgi:hypothetical protein
LSTYGYPVFPAAFVEEAVSSPLCVLDSFVEDQLAIDAWVFVWILYSDPLVFLSVFVPMPCCFYCYGSVVEFKVWYHGASSIGLFAQNCFGYSRYFVFPYVLHN